MRDGLAVLDPIGEHPQREHDDRVMRFPLRRTVRHHPGQLGHIREPQRNAPLHGVRSVR